MHYVWFKNCHPTLSRVFQPKLGRVLHILYSCVFLWLSSQEPCKIIFSFTSELLFWEGAESLLTISCAGWDLAEHGKAWGDDGRDWLCRLKQGFLSETQQKNLSSLRLKRKIYLFYLAGSSRRFDSGCLWEGLASLQVPPRCRSIVRALHHHKLGRTAWPSLQQVRRFLAEVLKGLHGAFLQLDAPKLDSELIHWVFRVVRSPPSWCLAY